MITIGDQQQETLKQLKHLSEDDKQKLVELSKKQQEDLKKMQPILKQLVEQEREGESEEEEKTDSSKEEQTSQSSKSTKTSSASSDGGTNKGTPWHIIIPVGILVIALIGGLAAFLIWRKKNNEKLAKK